MDRFESEIRKRNPVAIEVMLQHKIPPEKAFVLFGDDGVEEISVEKCVSHMQSKAKLFPAMSASFNYYTRLATSALRLAQRVLEVNGIGFIIQIPVLDSDHGFIHYLIFEPPFTKLRQFDLPFKLNGDDVSAGDLVEIMQSDAFNFLLEYANDSWEYGKKNGEFKNRKWIHK